METFRLRETKEFLSIDELKEKCDISDNFMDILKVWGEGGGGPVLFTPKFERLFY